MTAEKHPGDEQNNSATGKRIFHFECDGCGWIYSVVEMETIRFDFPCPRCGVPASQSTLQERIEAALSREG